MSLLFNMVSRFIIAFFSKEQALYFNLKNHMTLKKEIDKFLKIDKYTMIKMYPGKHITTMNDESLSLKYYSQ